jgi:hypothetical protein
MSEDQSASGATQDSGGIDSKKDTVAYETYKKAVSEAKKAKEQLSILQAENEAKSQAEMTEQGKYKEMVDKLQKDLKDKSDEIKRKESFFVQNNLKSTVHRYAKELGAIDGALDEVYEVAKSKGLLSSVELKEDYSVNDQQVKEALGELSKKSPWFFTKQVAAPKDVSMGGSSGGVSSIKDLTKLSYDDLVKLGKAAK